jgi:pre-rRNA-processing protein TSR2
VSLILEDIMETDFNTLCDDESPDELGDLFCSMWAQCGEGDYTLVTNALAREYARHETLSKCQGMEGGDECDSDDDGEDRVAAENNAELLAGQAEALIEEQEKAGPVIDEDGFELVTSGGGRRGRKPR